jgi:hypothetical protein
MPFTLLTVEVPTAQIGTKWRDEYCEAFNYEDTLPTGQPNPENRNQFARRKMLEVLQAPVRSLRQRKRDDANPITEPEIT